MKKLYLLLFFRPLKIRAGKEIFRNTLSYVKNNGISSYLMNAYGFSNFKILFSLKRMLFLLMFSVSFIAVKAQVTNTTIFPLNEYLITKNDRPYPVVDESKLDDINTSKFVNVMDYGAKGDGVTEDDEAIEKAFLDADYGVIFPANKTFLVSKTTKIKLKKDITVYAYGATIKMNDFSRYSFLSLEYEEGSYHNTAIWLGGTFDGNKNYQSWPGSPTGNDTWEEDHGRFFGISYAEFALVKDVTIVNIVMDGIGLEANKIAVITDSKASNGAPLVYSKDQDQGTYFKCTRSGSQAFYCMNLDCDGGSIGVHYSTKSVEKNSLTVVTNSNFYNQSQNALHFEDCEKVFLYKCTVGKDATKEYMADVHLSNSTEIASIKSCQFTNARVDFNNASLLEIGVIDSCQFVSELEGEDVSSLATCLIGATHCVNSSFTGKTDEEQASADNVKNCDFSNYSEIALRGSHVASNSDFKNGGKPINPAKDGVVTKCSFDDVDMSNTHYVQPDNNSWKKTFESSITILSDNDEYLGTITCGADSEETQNNMVADNISAPMDSRIDNQDIKLYPNPTTDVLHVTLNEKISGKTLLNVYDQQGQLVKTKTVDKNTSVLNETIEVENLRSGPYILEVMNGQKKTSLNFYNK